MKRRLVCFVVIICLMMGLAAAAHAAKAVGFQPGVVVYEEEVGLIVVGWFYNVGNTVEKNFRDILITVYDADGELVASSVFNDEELQAMQLMPGQTELWIFYLEDAPADTDLSQWLVTYSVNADTVETRNLGDGIKVFVDGDRLELNVPPVIENGRTLVPLRGIFEKMGASVDWDGATRKITVVKGAKKVILQIDSTTAWIDGEAAELDVPPKIIDGSTLVPLRFITQALEGGIFWGQSDKIIAIISE